MTGSNGRPGNAATLAIAVIGLLAGAAGGWWQATPRVDLAALEDEVASRLHDPDPRARRENVLALLGDMRPETVSAYDAAFSRELRFADECSIPPFAAAWAAFDAPSAFGAAVNNWKDSAKRGHAAHEIVYQVARSGDLERARYMAARLPNRQVRTAAWAGLTRGMLRAGDLEGATAFLQEHLDRHDRNRIIEAFLEYFLLDHDVEGALAWADAIPADAEERLKESVFGLTARWLTNVDPARVARWYDEQPEDADYTRNTHIAIAEEWTERDPEAALAWISKRSTPGRRNVVMRRVLRRFINHDVALAKAWFERQDPIGDAEVGLPYLIDALKEDRREALRWTLKLEDEGHRTDTLVYIAGQWMAQEPEAAREWVAERELSEDVLARIEAERQAAVEGGSTWQ